MWRGLSQISIPVVLVELWLVLAVHTRPLSDAGPHVSWGGSIRIMCLHTARKQGCYYLRIHDDGRVDAENCRADGERCRIDGERHAVDGERCREDGERRRVDGERHQRSDSLLEIRAVAVGVVAIKSYYSSLYLCMGSEGTLYGTDFYSPEECSFKEELLPNGHNLYKSQQYGMVVSLSKDKQRLHSKGKVHPPLSHFLPIKPCPPLDRNHSQEDEDDEFQYDDKKNSPDVKSMDPFGLIDYQSFHKK
ncbi:PREDICTED: fibroblast growth factor 19 [Nanorana parkeri]|uniref:fibroblast growth factor 19 n=1 Tax=Nanorana parkeri TaxID=125878 RepID=UPI000854E9A3|nr:PREDICTED: fibroblast growth factor 19 [Nanorana parkeri]